jgi:predicted NBD/HSP70 family sugar kinase
MQNQHDRAASRNGANLEHAHLLNQRVVLEAIRLRGPVSRIEVARDTKLTNQTVFKIVDGLRRVDLVRQSGRKVTERGQPAALFEVNPDGAFSVGLHLERDRITTVLVDFNGTVRSRAYRGDYLSTPEEARKQAVSSIKKVLSKHADGRISGLGIAWPGPVDSRNGKIISLPNFPSWERFEVRNYFQRMTRLPVFVDNDATAAAIGESWCGIGSSLRNFFYIYIGFGVGGGLILDGRPFRGASGNAGEIGHIVVDRSRRAIKCGCGGLGCLETRTSMRSLYRHLSDGIVDNVERPQLIDLFRSGDAKLSAWLETATSFISVALRDLQLLFDPEAFIIGGHLPNLLLSSLCEQCTRLINHKRSPTGTDSPRILQGSLEDEAAAIGAATLPTYNLIAPDYESIIGGNQSNLLYSD